MELTRIFLKETTIEMKKIFLSVAVLTFYITMTAQTPPVIYVAGDGSGDFNCDGVSDQVEINQALDYVFATSGFTTVYLKGPNTFLINEPVIISSNTIFTGDSTAILKLEDSVGWWTDCKPVIGQKNAVGWTPWGTVGDSISNVEIYGFEIDGGVQPEPSGATFIPLITFYFPHNVAIHDMLLQNSYWDIVRLSSCVGDFPVHSTVYNNRIQYSGHEGICFVGVTNFEAYNNEIYSTRTNCGIRAKNTDTLAIHGNIIGNSLAKNSSGYVGILVENEYGPLGYAEIYNNLIYGKSGGIHLGGNEGIYPLGTRKNVHIHHNIIFRTKTDTTEGNNFVMDGGIKINGYHNTIIEHNVIEGGVTDGIVYEGTSGGTAGYQTIVRNNIIINNGGYGINNKEPSINTFISNNNLVYNNALGNYNNTTSTGDIDSDPLFAGSHSTTNQWFHIVGTYDNATETFKIFVNGVEQSQEKVPGFGNIGSNSHDLFLGSYRGIAYWYEGKQDEFAVWNRALTQNEINQLYNNGSPENIVGDITNGLQAYLKMENNWDDSSGNNFNAIYSTATFTSDAICGNYSGEFENETYAEYPDYLSTTNGLSISVWTNRSNIENDMEQTILTKGAQENNDHIWLYFRNESVVFELGNGTDRYDLEANVVNPWEMDFHIKSEAGRWNGLEWLTDAQTSPCVDSGDPTSDYSNEPALNGGIANIGVYGNTAEASKSNSSVYYVSTSGSNSSPGTETQPWQSIQYAADNISPGDTVFIMAGTYNESVYVEQLNAPATWPTVFSAYTGDELNVVVDGSGISIWDGLFYVDDCENINVSGLKVINSKESGFLFENSDGIIIQNCETYNTHSSGIGIWYCNSVTVDGNHIQQASMGNQGGDPDVQECLTVSRTANFEVKNNIVHNNTVDIMGGEGIDLKDGCSNGLVHGNTVYDLHYDLGIYVDAYSHLEQNIEVYNNRVYNCTSGIALSSEVGTGVLDNISVYNNIVYDNSRMGIWISSWEEDGLKQNINITNNTIYDNGTTDWWGGGIYVESTNISNIDVRNNICSENAEWQIAVNTMSNITIDYNLIDGYRGYNEPGEVEVKGTNYLETEPLFIDGVNHDFHLRQASFCIDAGNGLNAPAFDFDFVSRPIDGDNNGTAEIDMGAYEFGIQLNLNAFLEGPFEGTEMNTDLLDIPLYQPYSIAPWNYPGTESVDTIPADVIDWVLIELRDTTDASLATGETVIARQAAFLLNDGTIVDTECTDVRPCVCTNVTNNLFVVIYHRNHLPIMSANPATKSGGVYFYDFTAPAGQAYGTDAQKDLGNGVFGMFGGNASADNTIDDLDKTASWLFDAGLQGYLSSDLNLDGQSNNVDKNEIWIPNEGKNCQVPE
jgi:hypothetical protein